MTEEENAGYRVPLLRVKELSVLILVALTIMTVYVFELESCAVTFTVIVFEPSFKVMLPEAVPEFTAVPLTEIDEE